MHVADVFVADAAGEPMRRVESVRAVDGGLAGDRYCTGDGFYSPFDVCQVTLVQAEALEQIERRTSLAVTDGQHRRNVVVRGGDVHELLGQRFSLGAAMLEGTRPRPPCRHVERVAGQDGLMRALADGAGGICARVADPGEFAVGDEVGDGEHLGAAATILAAIRGRLGR